MCMLEKYFITKEGDRNTYNNYEMLPHDTADAARLYGEINKKIRENILSEMLIKVKPFNLEVSVTVIKCTQTFKTKIMMAFIINEQSYSFESELSDYDLYNVKVEREILREVNERVTQAFCDKFTMECFITDLKHNNFKL